jgi:hypothetical protein
MRARGHSFFVTAAGRFLPSFTSACSVSRNVLGLQSTVGSPLQFTRGYAGKRNSDEDGEEEEQEQRERKPKAKPIVDPTFWEDLSELAIEHHKMQHDPRPMLSEETKAKLFTLHTSDPTHWTVSRLSVEFGLCKARTAALLMFQQMRAEAVAHGEVLNSDIVEELEKQFGVVDRYADKIVLEPQAERSHNSDHIPVDEDLDEEVYYRLSEKLSRHANLKLQPPKEELPPEPPKELEHQAQPKVLYRPTTPIQSPRGWLFVEEDDKKPFLAGRRQKADDATRLMYIREPDGTIRTPSWEERKVYQKPQLNQGKKKRVNWDYSILYRFDEKDLKRYHELVKGTPNLYPENLGMFGQAGQPVSDQNQKKTQSEDTE